ncbi:NUDIX hydrolase [Curtobacterium ammoniigenes]|uniref:NUDIX hydrolase n=1 Tax=Curtobacterium ammoniigenes TaxID=395387 RepID=UPI0008343F03|nr:NUDIX domain-containing protein [Curtobacterium ammoniigenes]
MTSSNDEPVLAAGAVCWRTEKDRLQVLVIHRAHHSDVSLPKGKVDPGEAVPAAAVREVDEETGYRIGLGAPLGTAEYVLPNGRDKVVHYWSAHVTKQELDRAGQFRPNSEVAAIDWVDVDTARGMLTYERDVAVLDRFAERAADGRHDTFAVIALRHAKTVPGSEWGGPDATRPLLPVGRAQARQAAPAIAAFAPQKIVSSTAARCQATVEPLSKRTKIGVTTTQDISQDAYERGKADLSKVIKKRLEKARTAVLCSHGPVLPEIIARIASRTTETPDRFDLRTAAALSVGSFAVLHIAGDALVAVETHAAGIRG